ncbi:hypothetical protein LOZ12_005443 [Ophidiomyces ophidiicola]|uniref:Uncharacterized protein n=1 Tax=Ophidiomyces ophidiicola TaxID=1387563 RepID=A0ACB8UQX3_9EURO|nr:hypothetical protein LOZ64_005830 [Ophidiomyces ophidiicola]KAI1949016.1 hypothetical protein LOZ62_002384 [Ophidiomyces ophidiicola]KAI1958715.1 hypothetical protein LOZ59_003399 [Ophidiomyces ophidiicola]KAI1973768.1 hypothetical protein LOZ56_001624 [Ophidiomyces ophidiicola]KAI2006719.1 hypothetical protein LOZ50_002938 [Ophidiomyces ophidiicola]
MAFSLGGASQLSMGVAGKVQLGSELQEIQTQEVGFLSLNGDSKIRLLPSPWPTDALPPPTSSLLSVASTKSLLAAAGPEGIVIASTDSVRKAFFADTTSDSNIRPFQPELQIPLPGKISHVAFSADENALVVAAQSGDGLAVYDVSALLQNNTQPRATISLRGESLRALAPNPVVSDLFAAITVNGELLVANIQTNQLEMGPSGPVLKTAVSSVSWSTKGKQLVAGLVDGNISQMTPKGETMAEIPKPPNLGNNQHVSSLTWLENHLFFIVYTPTDGNMASSYYIVTRHPPDQYEFRQLPEICSPFGLERYPSFQFTGRLRDFEPSLKEVLVVSSTASTDVGLLTRSSRPLADNYPADQITDLFTVTTMSEDSRRAELPMTEDMSDTSPLGLAIDLSSKDNVPSPIPGEDLKESTTPLPAILILNNDGVLSSWWFVYSESIRQQKPYRGLSILPKSQTVPQQRTVAVPETPKPAFGQPSFGQSSFGQPSFGKPTSPAFGSTTPLGANRTPAFGSPSVLGASRPAFGSTTPMGGNIAFGTASVPGQQGPVFGQSSLGSGKSLFGEGPAQATSSFGGGGFSSFASTGGFGGTITSHTPTQSPFSKPASDNPFANAGKPVFGAPSSDTSVQLPTTQPFSDGFVLGSTFKADPSGAMDEDKPEPSTLSFGSVAKSLDLGGNNAIAEAVSEPSLFSSPFTSITETKPMASKESPFGVPSKGLFEQSPQAPPISATTPFKEATLSPPKSAIVTESKPAETSLKENVTSPVLKGEISNDVKQSPLSSIPEPPLPPEPTSRDAYGPGDTSASSSSNSQDSPEDAPLPPDFLHTKVLAPQTEHHSPPEPPPALPEEAEIEKDEDFEDSGEEITHESSPTDVKFSPESSFGPDQSPTEERFTKFSQPEPTILAPKSLFGEIAEAPIFAPPKMPKGRPRLNPRSPSPVRNHPVGMLSTPEPLRSTSAPIPGHALSRRRAALESSALPNQVIPVPEDFLDSASREQAQRETEKLVAETQALAEDEDEQLRRDLARPLSPAPTLDPFLPHQDFTGESLKPGIPGQIERLYRDINAMIGTLGINARSLSAFMLFQQSTRNFDSTSWLRTLRSEKYAEISEEKLLLSEVDKLQEGVAALGQRLEEGKARGVQEKLEKCHELFGGDLLRLRSQCANMRQTLDSYSDAAAIASAPLSAEQSALQQDLRKLSMDVQSKLADLEKDISILRARIADCCKPTDGIAGKNRKHTGRPTVDAVMSTINTMTNMAEKKSGDIDALEAQMRKLGIDVSGSMPPRSRDGSPFSTPVKRASRPPLTPNSRTPLDGVRTSYHTPESGRTSKFRSSILSQSMSQSPSNPVELISPQALEKWKANAQRRTEAVSYLRTALRGRKSKLRSLDSF